MRTALSKEVQQAHHVAAITRTIFDGFDEEGNACFATYPSTYEQLVNFLKEHGFDPDTQIHVNEDQRYVRVCMDYFGLSYTR